MMILRPIKKSMTWVLVGLIILLSLFWIQNQSIRKLDRSFDGHDVYRFSSGRIWDYRILYENLSEKEDKALELLTETQHLIFLAHQNGDVQELTRQISLFNLLAVRQMTDRTNALDRFVYDKRLKPIWEDLRLEMPYDAIAFPKETTLDPFGAYLIAKMYGIFFSENIEPKYADDVDVVTYTAMYFDKIVPYLTIVAALFVAYASVNKEHNSGVIKLLLTQTISRKRYYLSKWLSGVIQVLFIIMIPFFFMYLLIGLKNGFTSDIFPIFAVKSKSPLIPYFDVPLRTMVESIGIVPSTENLIFHAQTTFISIKSYFIQALVLLLCFASFLVATIQWVSALIKDEILSFILSAMALLGFYGVSRVVQEVIRYNLFPYQIANTVVGVNDITVTGSVLLFLVGTVVMLIGGITYFNKKSL